MKPRSSVISVIASLIILFACFTQIGATAYIGNVNPTLAKSSRYESSYVVERFNSTHYQATNGTSGAVEFGPSTNASYIWQQTVSHNGTVFWKSGSYNCPTILTIPDDKSVTIKAEGQNSTILKYTGSNSSSAFLTVGAVKFCAIYDIQFNAANLTVHVLNWTGTKIVGVGAYTKFTTGIIERCHFNDASVSYGVALYRRNSTNSVIEFIQNRITSSRGGLKVACGDNKIIDNYIGQNGGLDFADLLLTTSGTNIIEGNYLGGTPGYGLYLNSHYNVITGNIIDHHYKSGIQAVSVQGNLIGGNKISDVGIATTDSWAAINFTNGSSENNSIVGNVIHQGDITNHGYMKYGISETNGAHQNLISGNAIDGYATAPFLVHSLTYVPLNNMVNMLPMENYGYSTTYVNGTAITHGTCLSPTGVFPVSYNTTIPVMLIPCEVDGTSFKLKVIIMATGLVTVGRQLIGWHTVYKP